MRLGGRRHSGSLTSTGAVLPTLILLVLSVMTSTVTTRLVRGADTSSSTRTLTWETAAGDHFGCVKASCWSPLDPQIAFFAPLEAVMSNVYEPLLWYNGTSSSQIVPWLARSYSSSANGTIVSFTLRGNITFADGQPLNSSDVYFSLNRLLIEDGNSPYGNGVGPSWTIQQLLNASLSTALAGFGSQVYNQAWADLVLGQNFVQITGPLTFNLHLQHPTASLPYLLASPWTAIVEPDYVMTHDLALWSAPNSTYREQNLLPYPVLGGSLQNRMIEYFSDEVSTCGKGQTLVGCASTYLESSVDGSLAGTGPYTIQSVAINRSVTLEERQDYWGGPYQYLGGQKISPYIQTIPIVNVPLQTDRIRDLAAAASRGAAMKIDLELSLDTSRLFDVVNQTEWLNHGRLVSLLPNVTVSGPFTSYVTYLDAFNLNVTLPSTGNRTLYQEFQPFADSRLRLAFADAVNLFAIDAQAANNQGQVATNAIPPGLPPAGAYNASILPSYTYDPKMAQDLLLAAMMNPVRTFHFINGTTAPLGLFNNTFGCPQLGSGGRCSNPVPRVLTLTAASGDTVNIAIMNQMAATINNVSASYNMGLHVEVQLVPQDSYYGNTRSYYLWSTGWVFDYPWVGDFDTAMFSPSPVLSYLPNDGWNLTSVSQLWNKLTTSDAQGNVSGVIAANSALNSLSNQAVIFLWTYYPYTFSVHTSNVQGSYYNPSLYGTYFAQLKIANASSSAAPNFLLAYWPIALVLVVAIALVLGVGIYVQRRSRSDDGLAPAETSSQTEVIPAAGPVQREITLGESGEAKSSEADFGVGVAPPIAKLEFERQETQSAFDYLVSSFIDDYMRKRLYSEQSGWRSLIQLSEGANIPQGFLYGRQGRQGVTLAELVSRGLVEVRTFTGQRGRGGEVVKVRVAYDKAPVKAYVDTVALKK